jgi:DNA-binding transcriptional regulator LsrR (DeoR family)
VSRVLSAYDPGEDEPLVTAAIMYYEAHRSQEQIARHLGVSRPTVSRLLARARQLGIVRIQIVPPTVDPAVADDLREKLKLRDVHIAPGLAEPSDPGSVLAGVLDEALDGIGLQAGAVMVIGWGRALYSLARSDLTPRPGIVVASALGGSDEDQPWFQSNEIVRRWAANLHGTARYLHAPAFVSAELKRSLANEEGIGSALDLWDEATAAVVGIGAWPPDPDTVALGFSASDPAIQPACGDVVGRFFAEDGTLVHYDKEPQLLAIAAEQLQRVPHAIGVAVGAEKAHAIIGAARAGLIDALVTDTFTARAVAALLE